MVDEQLGSMGILGAPPVMVNPFLFFRCVEIVNCSVVLVMGIRRQRQ